jgi:hypothetical protein
MHITFYSENMKGRYHLGALKSRESNIKMDLIKIGCGGIDWV